MATAGPASVLTTASRTRTEQVFHTGTGPSAEQAHDALVLDGLSERVPQFIRAGVRVHTGSVLLRAAVARLAPGGTLDFSHNFRRVRLDQPAITQFAQVEDISPATIPPDFERNPRIHRTWRLTTGT